MLELCIFLLLYGCSYLWTYKDYKNAEKTRLYIKVIASQLAIVFFVLLTDIRLRYSTIIVNKYAFIFVVSYFSFLIIVPSLLISSKAFLNKVKSINEKSIIAGTNPNTNKEILLFLLLSLVVGIVEEVSFRFFLPNLFGKLGVEELSSVVISNFIFGLFHINKGIKGFTYSFVNGLGYSLIYLYTGNLFLSAFLHVMMDAKIVWIAYILNKNKNEKLA